MIKCGSNQDDVHKPFARCKDVRIFLKINHRWLTEMEMGDWFTTNINNKLVDDDAGGKWNWISMQNGIAINHFFDFDWQSRRSIVCCVPKEIGNCEREYNDNPLNNWIIIIIFVVVRKAWNSIVNWALIS